MAKRTVIADEDDDDEGTDKKNRDMDALLHPWIKSQRDAQTMGERIQFNLILGDFAVTSFKEQIVIKCLKPSIVERNSSE